MLSALVGLFCRSSRTASWTGAIRVSSLLSTPLLQFAAKPLDLIVFVFELIVFVFELIVFVFERILESDHGDRMRPVEQAETVVVL